LVLYANGTFQTARSVVCPDTLSVTGSIAMAHPPIRVEGAALGVGALGKGWGVVVTVTAIKDWKFEIGDLWERRGRRSCWTETASMAYPLLDYSRLEDLLEGVAARLAFQTNPQCVRKQRGSENVITIKDWDAFRSAPRHFFRSL